MHLLKTGRVGLLAAIAAVVALVAVLPMFGSTAYAAGIDLNAVVSDSQFIIPAGPATRLNVAVTATDGLAPKASFDVCVTAASLGQWPPNGQILLSDDADTSGVGTKQNAEIMSYVGFATTCPAGKQGFKICGPGGPACPDGTPSGRQKGVLSPAKAHAVNSRIQLATTLSDGDDITAGQQALGVPAAGGAFGAQGALATTISPTQAMPFMITLSGAVMANFPSTGLVSVSHGYKGTPNVGQFASNVNPPGRGTEYFTYDMVGAGANQIRLTQRALQANGESYGHPADGFQGPGKAGTSDVDLHFQIRVKSNAGFFPSGNIMICDPVRDGSNRLQNCELMGRTLVNIPAIKTIVSTHIKNCKADANPTDCDQIHITTRAEEAATNKPAAPLAHPLGSVIVAPDTYISCASRNSRPGVDTDGNTGNGFQEPAGQVAGTSVGVGAVCYTRSQPNPPWTQPTKKTLGGQPIIGSTLIILNSIGGQPFLSTGGYTHVIQGAVPHVDTNGTNDNVLNLTSACIRNFTPGINLLVQLTLNTDKSFATPDSGPITVLLDSVTGPGGGVDGNTATHDDCDDPAAQDVVTNVVYDDPTSVEDKKDDTDRDGCLDERELRDNRPGGGLRDPWNPYDYYDINHDGAVNVVTDILQVAAAFGTGDPDYAPRKDRGPLAYGPFLWNKGPGNNNIDVVNDILGVATQFGDPCPHNHALYTGAAYPAGNAQWYGAGQPGALH